jgi:hypothetical protein
MSGATKSEINYARAQAHQAIADALRMQVKIREKLELSLHASHTDTGAGLEEFLLQTTAALLQLQQQLKLAYRHGSELLNALANKEEPEKK